MVGKPVEETARDERVILRALPGERAGWQRAATAARKTLSAWIRDVANAAAKRARGRR